MTALGWLNNQDGTLCGASPYLQPNPVPGIVPIVAMWRPLGTEMEGWEKLTSAKGKAIPITKRPAQFRQPPIVNAAALADWLKISIIIENVAPSKRDKIEKYVQMQRNPF